MNKKLIISILTVISLIDIFYIFLVSYNDYIEAERILSNNLLSADAVMCVIREQENVFFADLANLIDDDAMILADYYETSDISVFGVYFGNSMLNSKTALNKYFHGMIGDKESAVVGKNIYNNNSYVIEEIIKKNLFCLTGHINWTI